jgi:hypothetical protein
MRARIMVMNVIATTSMITTALGLGMMGRRGGAGIEGIISGGMGRGGWDGCSIRIFSFLFFQPLGVFFWRGYACVPFVKVRCTLRF